MGEATSSPRLFPYIPREKPWCWDKVYHFSNSISDSWEETNTGKNNKFPFLDILEYLTNTHKNPKFGKVRQVPTREKQVPWLGLVSLFQIWNFCGYSLNTLKYLKMGIRYFFLWKKKEREKKERQVPRVTSLNKNFDCKPLVWLLTLLHGHPRTKVSLLPYKQLLI